MYYECVTLLLLEENLAVSTAQLSIACAFAIIKELALVPTNDGHHRYF